VAIVIGLAMLLEIALSFVWPTVVLRASFLPRPPERSWIDECNNGHHRYYTRSGPFWVSSESATTIGCLGH